MSATSSPTGVLITTDRVRLRMSQYTAQVAGINGTSFSVNNLPHLFTNAGITQIQVNTSSQTKFENVSGVSGLNAGATVSLEGLLFKTPGGPVLVAKEVRKR